MNLFQRMISAIVITVAAFFLTIGVAVHAVENTELRITDELLTIEGAAMFKVLHEEYRKPMPKMMPIYHVGPTLGMPHKCAEAVACYHEGHVWLVKINDETRVTKRRLGILLHENMHHLQAEQRGPVFGCEDYFNREMEALTLQYMFDQETFYDGTRPVLVVPPHCKPKVEGRR